MKSLTENKSNSILKLWWTLLLVKLLIGAALPLSQDEAYYWVWSQHPQLSYFDHPAMVSWLFWLGRPFEFLGQAVRWPGIILGHLTLFIWFKILESYNLDQKKILLWLGLAITSPFLGLGSILLTPDLPVVFFWSLSMFFAHKIFESSEQANLKYYRLLGVSLGLGFCSKYHIVLFIPSLLIFVLLNFNYKKIQPRGVFQALLFGFLFSSPVLIWNYLNGFSSFKFQLQHGLGEKSWNPEWTATYLVGQSLLIFPTTLWRAIKSYKNSFLMVFSFFPLLFFLLSSLKGVVEVNWSIVAYPSIFALAVSYERTNSRFWSRLPIYFWGAITVFVIFISIYPVKSPYIPEKLFETHYFDPIFDEAHTRSPLYLGSYQMASALSYKYKKPFKKLYQINRHDLFDEINPTIPAEKHFFLIKEIWVQPPDWMNLEKYQITKVKDLPPKFELLEVTKND